MGFPFNDASFASFIPGDDKALEKVLRDCRMPMYYLCVKKLNDSSLAEDVVSEVHLNIWKNRSAFQDADHLKYFIYRLIEYRCIDVFRRRKKYRIVPLKEDTLYFAVDDQDWAEAELQARRLKALSREISELPPQCREVCRLFYEEGLSPNEIAQRMKIKSKTVYAHLAVAKKKIIARLKNRGFK